MPLAERAARKEKEPAAAASQTVVAPAVAGKQKQAQGKKQKADLTEEQKAEAEAKKLVAAEKRKLAKEKAAFKKGRKETLEAAEFMIGSTKYVVDLVKFDSARLVKDAIVVHIFDVDTPKQTFAIGRVTKKSGKGGSCWVKYPVDGTEFKHNLKDTHYLNYWAFATLKGGEESQG